MTSRSEVSAQVPGGTSVSNQAKAYYNFKSFATDTVRTNVVSFIVLTQPNFTLEYVVRDSNVVKKELVTIWLKYSNVGNAKADTITLRDTLLSTALHFVSAANGGVYSNNGITWRMTNISPGTTDSVSFMAQVDSTMPSKSIVPASAALMWENGFVSTMQNFFIIDFSPLILTLNASDTVVGSGRTIQYSLVVTNPNKVSVSNVQLNDTISVNGTYFSSNTSPANLSADGRMILWNLGLFSAGETRTVTLTLRTLPNLGFAILKNTATVQSLEVPMDAHAGIVSRIVPIVPKFLVLSAPDPHALFGELNADSLLLTADVRDSLHSPVPDGMPVNFSATLGTFANGGGNTIGYTGNNTGQSSVYLHSESVINLIDTAEVFAKAGISADSMYIFMYPGAAKGIVYDYSLRKGYNGALVMAFNLQSGFTGYDTTGDDGKFFIPLNRITASYSLEIMIPNLGDTLKMSINPTELFPKPAQNVKNMIVGRLQFNNGHFINLEGITIKLDSMGRTGVPQAMSRSTPGSMLDGKTYSVKETQTDKSGRFRFNDLPPAVYRASVDSILFPNYAGSIIYFDTTAGSITFNVNIGVKLDSVVEMQLNMQSPQATIYAGDTLQYRIGVNNIGNVRHSNLEILDTIPQFSRFLSAGKGSFSTAVYIDSSRSILWRRPPNDTLNVNTRDTVSYKVVLNRNMRDSTNIVTSAWLRSDQLSYINRSLPALVRSMDSIQFVHTFARDSIMAGDSVQAKVWFRNIGTDTLRNVMIVDTIFHAGNSLFKPRAVDSVFVKDKDSVIYWYVKNIPPGRTDSMIVSFRTDYTLSLGTRVSSSSYIVQSTKALHASLASFFIIDRTSLSVLLKVTKTANKKVAEIGDVVTYQILVQNTSSTLKFDSVQLNDQLPYAFKYYKNSGRFRRSTFEPLVSKTNTQLKWNFGITLPPDSSLTLTYQLVLGADAMESEGMNTVYASGFNLLTSWVTSAQAQWQVTVRPGVFTEKGLIIGKVFYDDDRNTFQDEGENGIKDVEIWMEDGTRIMTGDDGKYSLPEVKPGQHVLRVNENSLPKGCELLLGNTEFAKDPSSRFVYVTEGGIAKANFFVKRPVKDSISVRLAKTAQLITQRQSYPRILYPQIVNGTMSQNNSAQITLTFTYSGKNWLQNIEATDVLPDSFRYVDGSARLNGREVNPEIDGSVLHWILGRGKAQYNGTLTYTIQLHSSVEKESATRSSSVVSVMTFDSVWTVSDTVFTEHAVRFVRSTEETKIEYPERIFIMSNSQLIPVSVNVLKDIANRVKEKEDRTFLLVTYPDVPNTGTVNTESMQNLSMARAKTIMEVLNRRIGEDSVRVSAIGILGTGNSEAVKMSLMQDRKIGEYTPSSMPQLVLIERSQRVNAQPQTEQIFSASEISLVKTPPVSENYFSDSAVVSSENDVNIRSSIYIDPAQKLKSVILLDTLPNFIRIDEKSFTVNGIPVPASYLTTLTKFPSLTMRGKESGLPVATSTLYALDMTQFAKKGRNDIEFRTELAPMTPETSVTTTMYLRSTTSFDDVSITPSNRAKFIVKNVPIPAFPKPDRMRPLIAQKLEPAREVGRTEIFPVPPPSEKILPDKMTSLSLRPVESTHNVSEFKKGVGTVVVLPKVNFVTGSDTLTDEAIDALDDLAIAFCQNPDLEVQICGHTDNQGDPKKNKLLSLNRAKSIKTYFEQLGVSPKRLKVFGYGQEKPITGNDTREGRKRNRRVEFIRTK